MPLHSDAPPWSISGRLDTLDHAVRGDSDDPKLIRDPLDGLVNLFDVGMVLAIAFLIAGLTFTLNPNHGQAKAREGGSAATERVLPNPAG